MRNDTANMENELGVNNILWNAFRAYIVKKQQMKNIKIKEDLEVTSHF